MTPSEFIENNFYKLQTDNANQVYPTTNFIVKGIRTVILAALSLVEICQSNGCYIEYLAITGVVEER